MVISIIFWLIFVLLVLLVAEFLIVLYCGSYRIVSHLIASAVFCLCFGYLLLNYWQALKYFRTQPMHKIVAACLLEQHDKFVKSGDLDKAYSALVKACKSVPDAVCLWCRLALFCERTRKNSVEADTYMAKAEELITTTKADGISDKACYFDYRGLLNYVRGERDKGLEFIKQAIDIESKPSRIKMYEELLSDSKCSKSDTNPPDPKSIT
jgi:tetratricopeptide (TPR) repeat protein